MNWNAKLVTARALSTTAGNAVDADEGAFWLAGGDVPNVPSIGADRVSVINLSLGSDAPGTGFERDVMAAIIASGVTVVASAGNSGNNLPAGSPASCPGVISVGVYNAFGELTSYTNFATPVAVMALGGEGFANDPSVDILSVDGATTSGFKSIDGTLMAAPHVTGVVSLMHAINPQLSPRQIKALMDEIPFTCVGCNNAPALDAPTLLDLAASTAGEMTTLPPPPGSGSSGGGGGQPPALDARSERRHLLL